MIHWHMFKINLNQNFVRFISVFTGAWMWWLSRNDNTYTMQDVKAPNVFVAWVSIRQMIWFQANHGSPLNKTSWFRHYNILSVESQEIPEGLVAGVLLSVIFH